MGFSPSRNLLPLSYQKTAQKETLFFFEGKGDENRPCDPHRITGNKSILLFVDFCIFADSGDLRRGCRGGAETPCFSEVSVVREKNLFIFLKQIN